VGFAHVSASPTASLRLAWPAATPKGEEINKPNREFAGLTPKVEDMICTTEDDFVRDKLRWVVRLSNGDTVYQDDDRPGVEPASAWKRLKRHCEESGLHIVSMIVQFRSHVEPVGVEDAPGYFFVNTVMAVCGDNETTYHGYVTGYLRDDGLIDYVHWLTPSLVVLETGVRELKPEQSDCIIIRSRYELVQV
jgi:hypothetical protein